jgi:hypothetical protein
LRESKTTSIGALFDLDKSHKIFKEQGVEAYAKHQQENEDVVLKPGVGFTLVRKLLNLNSKKTPICQSFVFIQTVFYPFFNKNVKFPLYIHIIALCKIWVCAVQCGFITH